MHILGTVAISKRTTSEAHGQVFCIIAWPCPAESGSPSTNIDPYISTWLTLATRNSQTRKCVVFTYSRYILFWDTSFHFKVFIKILNCVPLYLKIKYNLHIFSSWITVYPPGEHEFTIFCTRHKIIKQSLLIFLSYYWPLYGLSSSI